MSAYNSQNYSCNFENGILIGNSHNGLEEPAWISMLYYSVAMELFSRNAYCGFSELIKDAKELVGKISEIFIKKLRQAVRKN